MNQVKTPNLKLNNIEFLCLKMHTQPGMPGRWYLRELHRYRFGTFGSGSWNSMYLTPRSPYRGLLFIDEAPKNRSANGVFTRTQSVKGSFRLLPAGLVYARRAAEKIGATL